MKMVRLDDTTNRKVEKLRVKLSKEDPLIKIKKGKAIDVAVTALLEEK